MQPGHAFRAWHQFITKVIVVSKLGGSVFMADNSSWDLACFAESHASGMVPSLLLCVPPHDADSFVHQSSHMGVAVRLRLQAQLRYQAIASASPAGQANCCCRTLRSRGIKGCRSLMPKLGLTSKNRLNSQCLLLSCRRTMSKKSTSLSLCDRLHN